ncbi:hypothetical protein [Acinetobacter guillouiae]|uniref:hypothetical protein n=1 Tax=Acinetobacter guillouiae TaxID=106649 RepID=UPI003AF744CC
MELISGKEALIALANGEEVECKNDVTGMDWCDANGLLVKSFFDLTHMWEFRLKPRTITINGIEVPAPFESKEGERFYYFSDEYTTGYASSERTGFYGDMRLGVWRTEEEIKQVVDALRKVFKEPQQ